MTPLVTIGLPFHNEGPFLARAVRSLLAQTFTDFALVLVDDGSTDDSLAVARSFRDPRIVVRSDGRRRHLAARLNEIHRLATTPFVARMDGDDVSHPDRLRRQLEVLERRRGTDAVGSLAALITDDDDVLGIVGDLDLPVSRATALERGLLVHASMLARRELLLANPYDEALTRAEDRDLWCRTAESAHYGLIREPLLLVRVSTKSERFLDSYVLSHEQNRALFLRYGPELAGIAWTAKQWLLSHGKVLVMRSLDFFGAVGVLVRRRGRTPTAAELLMVDEALRAAAHNA